MKSGYSIFWTPHALSELSATYEYLENNFSDRELTKLSREIEHIQDLIAQNPALFPVSETINARKVVVSKFNSMYYREKGKTIEVLSFFSNRQSPDRLKK